MEQLSRQSLFFASASSQAILFANRLRVHVTNAPARVLPAGGAACFRFEAADPRRGIAIAPALGMSTRSAWVWIAGAGFLLTAASMAGGCTAEVQPASAFPVADVNVGASEVEAAPYVVYEGRRVHYYRGRWYFRNGNNYSYYRDEPPALYRQRPSVQQAPPAGSLP